MKREFFPMVIDENLSSLGEFSPLNPNNKVNIIIPIYNEGKSIVKLVKKIHLVLQDTLLFRITIINDSSTDNTLDLLKNSSTETKIITTNENSGKGVSLIKGFNQCTNKEIIVTMDGDGEHLPKDIFSLIRPIILGFAQATIGARFRDNKFLNFFLNNNKGSYSNNGKSLNYLRRFGNWIFSMFIWMTTRVWIVDSQCGFRAYAPGVIQKLNLDCKGFQIETEITMNLINKGLKIVDVPIQTGKGNRPSYMDIVIDSIKNGLTIIRLKLPQKLNRWMRKIFPVLIN
jgi:glycosyltransferase involved in cell wall biosynthesis